MTEKNEHKYEDQLAGRLKLENQFLKNQLKECSENNSAKDKLISKLKKQISNLNMTIDNLSKEHESREKELLEKNRELEMLIDPPVEENKKSFVSFALSSVGIKVSEY